MDKRRTYDGSFKAAVVIEYMGGKSDLESLAGKYNVHPNQIKNWKSLLLKRASLILNDRRQNRRESPHSPKPLPSGSNLF